MRRVALALLVACGAMDPSTPPTSVTSTFAIHDFYFGDTSRDTNLLSYDAWKTFGRNIDGKVTGADSTDVCTLYPNGKQVDGNDGIDNAFGAAFAPNVEGGDVPPLSTRMSADIQQGRWTLQIQVVGLSDDPAQTSTGLVARAFASASYGESGAPAFDETTEWPVISSSLADGATLASGAIATFPNARIDHGVFDSGEGTLPLLLDFSGEPIVLLLHDAVITFVHASRTEAAFGTLSGVLDLDEFIAEMHALASQISTSLCGSAFDGLAAQYRAAADILADGTNAPGVPCDGISVGFGFDARLIANPSEVAQASPLVDLCAN